jgi:hypothetical protein
MFLVLVVLLSLEQLGILIALDYHYLVYPYLTPTLDYYGYADGLAHIVLFVAIFVLVMLIDVILDVKRKGCFTGYITIRDPLNFRMDFLFIILQVVFVLCYSLMSLIGTTTPSLVPPILRGVFELLFRTCFVIAGGLGCVCVILRRACLGLQQPKEEASSRADQLQYCLSDEKRSAMFAEYCRSEFSSENLLAYYEIKLFSSNTSHEEKVECARRIYSVFIAPNSLNEVNMSTAVRNEIHKKMEKLNGSEEESKSVINEIFIDFEKEVRINLIDTFARFQLSSQYRKVRRRSSFETILEGKEVSTFVDQRINTNVAYMSPESAPTTPAQLLGGEIVQTPVTPVDVPPSTGTSDVELEEVVTKNE